MARSDTEKAGERQRDSAADGTPREFVVRVDRRRGVWGLVVVVLVVLSLVLAGRVIDWFPKFSNPFAEHTVDRSQPALLQSVQDLSRYEAAAGNFQVVIDLERDARFLPSSILGERTLFVAAGSVDVYVDFAKIGSSALKVSKDRKSVEIRLPSPALEKPNLDHEHSYVFAQERGIVNRVQSVFGDDSNRLSKLYQLAEQKLRVAAQQSGLTHRAEQNTKAMLVGLFRSLDFSTVTVTFQAP